MGNWQRRRRPQLPRPRRPQRRRRLPRLLNRRLPLNKKRQKRKHELTKPRLVRLKKRPRLPVKLRRRTKRPSRRSRKTKPRQRLLPLLPLLLLSQHPSLLHRVSQLLERQRELRPADEFFQRKKSTLLYLNCSRNTKVHSTFWVETFPIESRSGNGMTLPNFIGMINQFGHAISETDIDDHGNTVRRNQY